MPTLRFVVRCRLGMIPLAPVVASGVAARGPDDLRPAILTVIAVSCGLLPTFILRLRKAPDR